MRVLCLSFWTPPTTRPQAILIGKMVPEWLRRGVEPTIVAYQGPDWSIGAEVVRIPIFSPFRGAGRLGPLHRHLQARYRKSVARRLADLAAGHDFDLIFAFANPMVSNHIGALLKQRTSLPLITHFSDPYARAPFRSFTPAEERRALHEEAFILEQSDAVVFVNPVLRDFVCGNHRPDHKSKAGIVPHCFDPDLYPDPPPPGDKLVISHLGSFYGPRTPSPLLDALELVLRDAPALRPKLRVDLVGACGGYTGTRDEPLSETLKVRRLDDVVRMLPPVDYLESLAMMRGSHCLVVIDADLPGSPFLPSKLIDYAGSGTHTIAITPAGSPSWTVTRELGGKAFSHGQAAELAAHLAAMARRGGGQPLDEAAASRYSVSHTTTLLLDIFKQTLASARQA